MPGAKLVTVALIIEEGKVLLIQRGNEPDKGKWALPGGVGGLKKFPQPIEAVQDEVHFDLGTKFNPDKLFNYYYRTENDGSIVTLVFTGEIADSPNPNPDSVKGWKFISHREMFNLELAFDHYQILKEFFNK